MSANMWDQCRIKVFRALGWIELWGPIPPTFPPIVKVKVEHYSAPSRRSHHKGAQVHGAHQAASHVPALYLPSYSRYSFTDPERMEG